MELWQLWLLFVVPQVAENISTAIIVMFVCSTIGFIAGFLWYMEDCLEEYLLSIRKLMPVGVMLAVLLILSSLVPNKKDAMLIVGGYYALNIEGVADLPPNVVKATNKFIEEYLNAE